MRVTKQSMILSTAACTALLSAFVTTSASAQCESCATPIPVSVGSNAFSNTPTGCIVDMTGACTMQFTPQLYNTNFYSFTPSASGFYRLSLCGTATFDTKIAVMNGCSPAAGVLACNDDGAGCSGFTSLIPSVQLVGGTTYIVAIGGYSAADPAGSGTLTISQLGAPGGGCSSATNASLGLNAFNTSNLTEVVDLAGFCDPGPFGDDKIYGTQYFRFTPSQSGLYSVSTCGTAGFDTRLAVMEGCSPVDGVLGCNDDGPGCPNFSSKIDAVDLEAGVTYYILVGGFSAADTGAGQFEIAPFVPCELAKATVVEAEACGEDTNGGCNSDPPASEPVAVGDIVSGTFWADGGTRDTDWYLLDLATPTEVTVTIRSNLNCFVAFVDPAGCTILGEFSTGQCPGTTSFCFAPGQYYIVALTSVFSGYPCGGVLGNEYTMEITGVDCEAAVPPNDNCADAAVAIEGPNAFDNTFASTEVADPSCGFGGAPFTKDVWFSFTATQEGSYTFETCSGSAPFDTGIEIWDSCPSNGGSVQKCNDDGINCDLFASSLNYCMTAGQTVLVRVGGWQGATGATELVIAFSGACVACGDPSTGDCCVANTTPYCSDAECCTSVCAADAFCCDVEWDQLCANQAIQTCASCAGQGCGNPDAGSCCTANTGPFCSDETCCNSVCAADAFCCQVQWDAICASEAVTICGTLCGGGGGGCSGCNSPTVVTVGNTPFTTTATGCQVDLTGICDPGPAGTDIIFNASFFSFTPTQTGAYSVSTCTASFDTKIAVMNNCTPSNGVLGCNDDGAGCGLGSLIPSVNLTAGTTYIIAVGGYSAATPPGTGTLTIATVGGGGGGPPNDLCANATVASVGANSFTNVGATGSTATTCATINKDVWFKFTATGNQSITVSFCPADQGSSTLDTVIGVFTACGGTQVACNDDSCGLQSKVTFTPTCGTTYYIGIGSWSTVSAGTGTFTIAQAGQCAPPCPADFTGDGQVAAQDLAFLLGAWGTAAGDLTGNGTTDAQDLAALLGAWGPCVP